MDLNKNIDYEVLYKIIDEREAYYTEGVWYIRKYLNPNSSVEPIIYIYHFNLDGKVIDIHCGNYVYNEYHHDSVFTIKGWVIDKDSPICNVGKEETQEEMDCAIYNITPITEEEQKTLDNEIIKFLNDPTAYLKNKTSKGSI